MTELSILLTSALSIAFFHTIIGPDHYLPFIVLSRARGWSLKKTAVITVLCGVGHVSSSIVLGFIGVAFGIAVSSLVSIESVRGEIAAWGLIAFGLLYGLWGIRKAQQGKSHSHFHQHSGGLVHTHYHSHGANDHVHLHGKETSLTPWVLFVIFVLGPCEPLIPLLMYPAAQGNWHSVVLVSLSFGLVTIVTMVGLVLLVALGLFRLNTSWMERYVHALAGFVIATSGLAIKFLGL